MTEIGTRAQSGEDIDCGYEPFAFQDLPRRNGLRPATFRRPLHIQCNGYGDPHHLDELTAAICSWPYVERNPPLSSPSNTLHIRLEETAAGNDFAAFITPREFARVLLGNVCMESSLITRAAKVRAWVNKYRRLPRK